MSVITEKQQSNGTSAVSGSAYRLPDLPELQSKGIRLVHGAVRFTFLLMGVGMGMALLVASLVEIDVTVDADGSLEPVSVWPVRIQEAGIIAAVLVATGDSVQRGDVLVQLDSLPLKSSLAQLRAEYALRHLAHTRQRTSQPLERQQKATLRAQAEADRLRARAALREKMVTFGFGDHVDSVLTTYSGGTHVVIDLALSDVLSAEARLQHATAEEALSTLRVPSPQEQHVELENLAAQIQTLKRRLKRLSVTAPASGVVLTEGIERQVGAFVREGDLLLELAEVEAWRAQLFVHERDIHTVHLGDLAKLEIQAFRAIDQDLFYGRVISMAAEPGTGNASIQTAPAGSYRVTVQLDQAEVERLGYERLKRGYSIRGKIITRSGRILERLWRYVREQMRL